MLTYDIKARNPLSVLLFAGLCVLFFLSEKKENVKSIWAVHVGALLLSTSVFLVKIEHSLSEYTSSFFRLACIFIMASGLYILFYHLLKLVIGTLNSVPEKIVISDGEKPFKGLFAISFFVCLVSYIPWFLYSFPGIFSPDPITQFGQIIGASPFSNHHPIVHTLLIGLWYKIGGIFSKDINFRISFYTAFQMAFLAFSASYVISTLNRALRIKVGYCFLALAFYAFTPFMCVFSIVVGKDTIFASLMMIFTCEIVKYFYDDKNKKNVLAIIRFVTSGIAVCLFRTNGFYAFVAFAFFFVILSIKDWKSILVRILPILVIASILRGPVINMLHIEQPDIAESLHVPTQQISRVIVDQRPLYENEIKLLYDVCDISYVKQFYVPYFADNIKELVRAGHPEVISENKMTYIKLYVKLGLRYPNDYILAWKDLVENVIYPDGDYDVSIMEGVVNNNYGVSHSPIIGGPRLLKIRELLVKTGDYIPLYGFLWSMGTYTWLLVIASIAIISQKENKKRVLILIPGLAVIFTLLLAIPSAKEFRYALPYAVLMPISIASVIVKPNGSNSDEHAS